MAIYTSECIVRVTCDGLEYFKSLFNIMDFLIVSLSVADTWVLSHMGQSSNLNMIRVIRLVRLVRVIRLVRLLRFFKELMSAFRALTLSISSVAWMCLLLVLFTYVYAMMFNLMLEYNVDNTDNMFPDYEDYFGNKVYKTAITLFQVGSGFSCEGFPHVIRPLMKISSIPLLSFFVIALYLVIFRYAFLTALVGVFVNSVSENEQLKQDERLDLNLEKWKHFSDQIVCFITTCHLVYDDCICMDDFMIACDHPYVIERLIGLQLNLYSPILLFNLLDYEKNEKIPVECLSDRLVSLRKGGPSEFALHAISQQMASIRAIIHQTSAKFNAIEFDSILSNLANLESDIVRWITCNGSWTQKQRMAGNITRNL